MSMSVDERSPVAAVVPPQAGSQLALDRLELAAGGTADLGETAADTLLYVVAGAAALDLAGAEHGLEGGSAGLVLAGERAQLRTGEAGVTALVTSVARQGHRHAPMGERAVAVATDEVESGAATGSRSFQILFGPQNGSLFATLFAGSIPPGAATLHYHLYDEIVVVLDGPGRLHLGGRRHELSAGSAFRLTPHERHIVENLRDDAMTVLGLFTPAGSPSAAYLD